MHASPRLPSRRATLLAGAAALLPLQRAGAQEPLEKVKLGSLRFVSSGAVFIALERGYFKDEGLDVAITFFDAAQPIALATASGDLDLGVTAFTGGLFNLAGKGALKIIAAQAKEAKGYEGNLVLVSNAAWDKGFRDVSQFAGHSIGITQIGSSFHYQIGQIAAANGIDLKTIAIRPLQSLLAMAAALKTGQVNSIIIAPHLARAMIENGDAKPIARYSDLDEYQFGGLFTTPKAIGTRRPMLEKFVRAYQKGAQDYFDALLRRDDRGRRIFDEKAAAAAALIAKYVYPTDPPGKAATLVEASAFYVDPQARIDVADILKQIAWYKAQGLVAAEVDGRAALDLSFVKNHFNAL
ncbi:MAG: ABC transporter substrate-binding protein [Hyphomicrobiales bacterium]|nr:ABC transporter substrate-binding protein [Hyphomicrobiales bacterium]